MGVVIHRYHIQRRLEQNRGAAFARALSIIKESAPRKILLVMGLLLALMVVVVVALTLVVVDH